MQRPHRNFAASFLSLYFVFSTTANAAGAVSARPASPVQPLMTPDHAVTIYRHLVENHWVPDTGLFISFLNTGDNKLVQQASTYDQAAVGILALRLGDVERATGIFNFMRTAWTEGPLKAGREGISGLANFYNAEFNGEGVEKIIHTGPNAWAALFAAQLGNRANNKEATAWAISVARWIAKDLPHNDGAVAMGPRYGADNIPWPRVYSTENNLSYYALLAELLHSPELAAADRVWVKSEKSHVEDWLVTTGFDRLAYSMNRGVNPNGVDRTRALDTVTWLIAAIGPQRLLERGIDPDRLMRQTEESFVVKVGGRLGVDPTDQPEADLAYGLPGDELVHRGLSRPHQDRHRMIWYEGLGEYISVLRIMAEYSKGTGRLEKAREYAEKARRFTAQFDLAAIKTGSAGKGAAYPYATEGKFFHDGWFPPKDAPDGRPSSLIAGVWRCFAGLGINPLSSKDIAESARVVVSLPAIEPPTHRRPSILYGASEDMVIQAWLYLDQGDSDHALQQARATIQEWSPWALRLQDQKARRIGHLVEYAGLPEQRKEIFSYWALNDVAAASYILGKAFDAQKHYGQAVGALQQIVLHYPLAQIWDPRGWFWSPLESIGEDFVNRDPRHYGDVKPQMLAATQKSESSEQN